MTIIANIAFMQRQLKVFGELPVLMFFMTMQIKVRCATLADQIRDYRAQIRAAKETLASANSVPSVAEIFAQIRENQQRLSEGAVARENEFRTYADPRGTIRALGRTTRTTRCSEVAAVH